MKRLAFLLPLAALVICFTTTSFAVTWTKIGSSGFSTTPSLLQDKDNIIINSIAVDDAGNIYATANNGNNDGSAGGVTIFKPDGTKIDVDVDALGFSGGITKLLKAGDGKIYGIQNWCSIQTGENGELPNRILCINPDGTVEEIISLVSHVEGWILDMDDTP